MEQYVLSHDVSVISTPVQGTMLMIRSCQLTLLFLTLAFKARLENLRQTLPDMCEREGITNVTVSSPTISPSRSSVFSNVVDMVELCSVPLEYHFTIFAHHLTLLCFPKPVRVAFLWNSWLMGPAVP